MVNHRKILAFILSIIMLSTSIQQAEAVTYVTDMGGCAYDEARAAVNLAPAIALATVAIVAIIAIGVQNSHGHSSSSSGHFGPSCSCSSYSSCSSCSYSSSCGS